MPTLTTETKLINKTKTQTKPQQAC